MHEYTNEKFRCCKSHTLGAAYDILCHNFGNMNEKKPSSKAESSRYGNCVRCWTAGQIGGLCNFCLDGSKMLRIVDEKGQQIDGLWIAEQVNREVQHDKLYKCAKLEGNDFYMTKTNFQYLVKAEVSIQERSRSILFGVCKSCHRVGPVGDYCNYCVDENIKFYQLRVVEYPEWKVDCEAMTIPDNVQLKVLGSRDAISPGYIEETLEEIWTADRNYNGYKGDNFKKLVKDFLLPN